MNAALRALINRKRTERGLSPEALAAQVDCSPHEITGFERGLFALRANLLYSIFKTLKITADEVYSVLGQQAADILFAEANFLDQKKGRP